MLVDNVSWLSVACYQKHLFTGLPNIIITSNFSLCYSLNLLTFELMSMVFVLGYNTIYNFCFCRWSYNPLVFYSEDSENKIHTDRMLCIILSCVIFLHFHYFLDTLYSNICYISFRWQVKGLLRTKVEMLLVYRSKMFNMNFLLL